MANHQPTRHSILPHHASTSHPHSNSQSTSSAYTSTQSTTLQNRINAKKSELSNLISLRDLSSQLATQMTVLEEKLSTLSNGAGSVAEVMRNWDGVLGVLSMVGGVASTLAREKGEGQGESTGEREADLPVTLVRIPVEMKEESGGGGGG